MLKVNELESGYGVMQVLWQPGLEVKTGSITSIPFSRGSKSEAIRWPGF